MAEYQLPSFLVGVVDRPAYVRWLHRRAVAHVRRDRRRGNTSATVAEYKKAMHEAVHASRGRDAYTNEKLEWNRLSAYDNAESARRRREYKAELAMLPTVDHVGDGLGQADFAICAWRTNDAKGDMTRKEFIALCKRVLLANKSVQPTAHRLRRARGG